MILSQKEQHIDLQIIGTSVLGPTHSKYLPVARLNSISLKINRILLAQKARAAFLYCHALSQAQAHYLTPSASNIFFKLDVLFIFKASP